MKALYSPLVLLALRATLFLRRNLPIFLRAQGGSVGSLLHRQRVSRLIPTASANRRLLRLYRLRTSSSFCMCSDTIVVRKKGGTELPVPPF